jgi:predicted pyridoxine 5'-phosphate oxidase superfamily flavin-nucleotide-binding protein
MESVAKELPGSQGEHDLQDRFGTQKRACGFYSKQMLDHLNEEMCTYIARQEMAFVATADENGECDCSLRCGKPGFVRVLDDRHLVYPEYRGNGVMASLGNISTNEHIGMFFVDFFSSTVGLHVNGKASIIENEAFLKRDGLPREIRDDLEIEGGRRPECWVEIDVEEAYIHCSKHVPLLKKLDKSVDWGTDDEVKKGGDFFNAKKSSSPWKDGPRSTGNNG